MPVCSMRYSQPRASQVRAMTAGRGADYVFECAGHKLAFRLSVECVEAQMKDLGPVWEAVATPGHPNGA